MREITCGCDPEVLIIDGNTGMSMPALGVAPGSKDNPFIIEGSKVGLMIQEDNVALEFNMAPCSIKEFPKNIQIGLKELDTQVKKYFGAKTRAYYADHYEFTEAQLSHPNAHTFGCDPDYLAHRRGERRKPIDPKTAGNTRFFGGHLHIGYDKAAVKIPEWAIVQGIELGAYTHAVIDHADSQPGRRKFYGLAGLYRPKPYGLEYRTPSNFWLMDTRWATDMLTAAQEIVNRPKAFRAMYDLVDWDAVANITNNSGRGISGDAWRKMRAVWDNFLDKDVENA